MLRDNPKNLRLLIQGTINAASHRVGTAAILSACFDFKSEKRTGLLTFCENPTDRITLCMTRPNRYNVADPPFWTPP